MVNALCGLRRDIQTYSWATRNPRSSISLKVWFLLSFPGTIVGILHHPQTIVIALHNAWSPIIAAIFAGNAIVLKCSKHVVWSTNWFMGAIHKALEICGHNADIIQVSSWISFMLPLIAVSRWSVAGQIKWRLWLNPHWSNTLPLLVPKKLVARQVCFQQERHLFLGCHRWPWLQQSILLWLPLNWVEKTPPLFFPTWTFSECLDAWSFVSFFDLRRANAHIPLAKTPAKIA